jgi:hypothetical protein
LKSLNSGSFRQLALRVRKVTVNILIHIRITFALRLPSIMKLRLLLCVRDTTDEIKPQPVIIEHNVADLENADVSGAREEPFATKFFIIGRVACQDHTASRTQEVHVTVRQTRSVAQGVLQNQPLAIVAAGLAAGAALAAAFPPTELEKETLGPVGDQMSKAAERFGDQLKQATARAGEKLKTAAEERGLHTEGLKDVAGEVVDTFKASMTGQAEQNDRGPASRPDSADGSR